MVEAERVSDFVTARNERNMASVRHELDVGGGVSVIVSFPPSAHDHRNPTSRLVYSQHKYLGIRYAELHGYDGGTALFNCCTQTTCSFVSQREKMRIPNRNAPVVITILCYIPHPG